MTLAAPAAIQARLLGPFEMTGVQLKRGSRLVRRTLALLVVNAGHIVTFTDLIRELWPDGPIGDPMTSIQTYVMALRKQSGIGRDGITTASCGYALTAVHRDEVDVWRYMRLVDKAHAEFREERLREATDVLLAAGSLWRGGALEDVDCGPKLAEWQRMVADRQRTAVALGFEVALRSGRHRDVLDGLRAAWRADKTHEPTAAQLMLALHRSQLRGEALEVFGQTRAALLDGLGLDPGVGLRRLQQQILAGDPELEAK